MRSLLLHLPLFDRTRHWLCVLGVALAIGGESVAQPLPAAAPRSERQVKAAYIFNFGRFIVWPEPTRRGASSIFTIGVLGDDRLAEDLVALLHDRTIRDQPVDIRRVRAPEDLDDLRILVVGELDSLRWTPSLAALREKPVLIVGSTPEFARSIGHVGFYLDDQRVRFAINPSALRRSNLQASSRLLSLALIVDTDPVAASPMP